MTILIVSLVVGSGCQNHKVEGLLQNREITPNPKPNLKPPPQLIENE